MIWDLRVLLWPSHTPRVISHLWINDDDDVDNENWLFTGESTILLFKNERKTVVILVCCKVRKDIVELLLNSSHISNYDVDLLVSGNKKKACSDLQLISDKASYTFCRWVIEGNRKGCLPIIISLLKGWC